MSVKAQRPAVKGPARQSHIPVADAPRPIPHHWLWIAGCAGALLAAIIAYGPALRGQFLFDDVHMRFYEAHPERLPLHDWVIGARPLINFTYWLNYRLGGTDPLGYHLINIFLHTLAAVMVFLIMRKILQMAARGESPLASVSTRRITMVAGFCAAVFLLHPVQTEAVAYVAQRSESFSVALAFAAWVCFLYRPTEDIRLPSVILVLLLFGASVTAKEHVAVLPAVLLLTDYYWNPGFSFQGIRRNWRLYGTMLAGCVAVGAFLYSYLANEPSVGFQIQGVTWYQYLFTQFRMVFLYPRLFVLPVWQSADYYVELSRTPLEHGSIFGLAVLLAAFVAAIYWRKRYPLASYGFFVALVFFIPTSSIMAIRDYAAERRLYLPMIGLLLIVAEFLMHLRADDRRLTAGMAGVLLVLGWMTWSRSEVWASPLAFWSDVVEKTPEKARGHFGLATAEYSAGRFADAVTQYKLAEPEYSQDGMFYSNLALALDRTGHSAEAIRAGRRSVQLTPSAATYSQLAMYLAENGDSPEALEALDKAEKQDSSYEPIYIYRGNILAQTGHKEQACAAFQKAASLEPADRSAAKGLAVYGCGKPR